MSVDGVGRGLKERIVAASLEPGAVASEVARAAGIHASQLFRWRQQLCRRAQVPATFNPVAVTPEAEASMPPAERAGTIEIELTGGGRMRITGAVEARMVAALMRALAKGKLGDDPGAERCAGLAGGGPHRHAQGL
ncbi:MAG: transposase [Steroidobacteraceae bacterium]